MATTDMARTQMEPAMTPSPETRIGSAAGWLQKKIDVIPVAGIMTGTGLAAGFDKMAPIARFDYRDIPHFPEPTVQSHPGELRLVTFNGKVVMVFQGRLHLYEGYQPWQVTFPVRLMQTIGVKHLFVTNSAGGLNPSFEPGQIMVITDQINLTGVNPLVGPNIDEWGPRFPDMSHAYDPFIIKAVSDAARKCSPKLSKGVYAGLKGPCLETPAEIRYLQSVGADAVGFSTVCEVIAAVHGGMRVTGFSTITNVHTPEDPQPVTLDEIISVAQKAAPQLACVMHEIIRTL